MGVRVDTLHVLSGFRTPYDNAAILSGDESASALRTCRRARHGGTVGQLELTIEKEIMRSGT
jgi:hypothetical protein